jgi:glyoxylase-like metal-dependent hydrolase (beta-lactamase superfamily II)
MKIHSSIVMVGMLAASLVCAENLTQTNVERARSVIDKAVTAHGGNERLSGLESVVIEHETITWAVDQSLKPEAPWDQNASTGITAINLDEQLFMTRNRGTGGGFEFDGATIINGDDSFQLNYRSGTIARVAEPDFDTTSGPMIRVTPALLVRTLRDRQQNAYFLGEVEEDGRKFEVVGFSMTVGPAISLYFDKGDHRPYRSERMFPGVGLVQYRFSDYETVDGIAFNRNFELTLNGDPNMERNNLSVKVNEPLGELLAADDSLDPIPEVIPDELRRQEISDGIYLIGGSGTYAMFVDMGEYIVATGATGGIPERIELLRDVVGDKPIRYAVMTHHHFDHVMGVSAYEAEGATLITAPTHETIVRRAAEDGDSLKLKTVDERFVLESGSRVVEIIDVGPTAHSEELLVTYLPEEKLLFQADHFSLPQTGPVPPAVSSTRTFAAALVKHDIDVQNIASAHSPRIGTIQELRMAVDKEVPKVSQNRN